VRERPAAYDILIVDDEADIRELISEILQDEGYETRLAANSDETLLAIEDRRPSLVILDIWLQGSRLDGLEVLDRIQKMHPDIPVIIISGHGNIETAVTAIKRGAYEFIEKPFNSDKMINIAQRAIEAYRLRKEVQQLREHSPIGITMIGTSAVINHLRQSVEKVAPTNSRVLITGPSGAGKELTARLLHSLSHRANAPFVALNAAAITPERMEIELFGTVEQKNAPRKVGALEEAHLGTLYIDEIADMPLETQSKILRVLVEQKFQRVGSGTKVEVDVRIVSSSSRDLAEERRAGNLREDLYHRLNVVPLIVPSLAERREDIPALVDYFIKQVSIASGLAPRKIGEDAMAILQSYEWPGNVRQLRNIIERLMILSEGDSDTIITAEMLPEELGGYVNLAPNGGGEHLMSLPLRDAREIFEREYLLAQINRFGGNISRTAEFIGMERSALHRKLRVLGVNATDRKKEAI
jgi:two-component system nitrogen regulation response regulator NtrX